MTIKKRLDLLQSRLIESRFLENKGLGNEVGFYIFDYDPKDELIVRVTTKEIIQFTKANHHLKIKEYDLYKIMLAFFETRNYMDKNFKMEEMRDSFYLFDNMRKALKVATERDEIVNYIASEYENEDVLFITGVGKVFPILRSHAILNNLQTIVEDCPLVMFYPGRYESNSLRLFSQFHDDHYYRAFQIVEWED